MASTELGFLALPQFLKGTPELSILPSLPPLDPFTGVTGRRQGMGRLLPRRPPDWWCRGSGPQRKLVEGRLAVVPVLEGPGREGGSSDKRSIKTRSSGGWTGFGLASNFSFSKRG